jgi:hypothetical protein
MTILDRRTRRTLTADAELPSPSQWLARSDQRTGHRQVEVPFLKLKQRCLVGAKYFELAVLT